MLVFETSLLLLNIFLAWDSRLLLAVSPPAFSVVYAAIRRQDLAIWGFSHLDRVTPYAYVVSDLEVLVLLAAVVASAAWLGRGRGLRAALLRSTGVGAGCLAAYEVELALLDPSQLFVHVTDFQSSFRFLPWFSNADLLACSLALLAADALLLLLGRPGRVGAGPLGRPLGRPA